MVKVTPYIIQTVSTVMRYMGGIASAFYLVIFLIYVRDIGIVDVKSDDMMSMNDLPLGLLLSIEIVFSILLLLGGLFSNLARKNAKTRYALLILTFLSFVAFVSTLVFRAATLWGNAQGQCRYFGQDSDGVAGDYIHACPTTRHENQGASPGLFWKVEKSEPTLESDCVFWFWDNTFTLESVLNGNSGASVNNTHREALKDEMIENMDWTQKHLYGYYGCKSGSDCVTDGRTLFETIQNKNLGVSIKKKLSSTPDISFCYYWGCSSVCNPDRYRVNRILLYSAFVMSTSLLIFLGIVGALAVGQLDGFEEEAVAVAQPVKVSEWKPMVAKSGIHNRSRKLRF